MAGISRPEKELNTFKEVVLSSGERKDVGVIVAEDDLKFCNRIGVPGSSETSLMRPSGHIFLHCFAAFRPANTVKRMFYRPFGRMYCSLVD